MATSHSPQRSPQRCHCHRRRSYKQMVQDVAEDLGMEDVQKIVFQHDLPVEYNNKPALAALRQLEMQGEFSDSDIGFLESLLKGIHRYDLINKHVMPYQRNYCGCDSGVGGATQPIPIELPATTSPHIPPSLKPLAHTFPTSHDSGDQSRLQPEDKRALHDLLQYVPQEVMKSSTIAEKLFGSSFLLSLTRNARRSFSRDTRLSNSSTEVKDGPKATEMSRIRTHSSRSFHTSMLKSGSASEGHQLSTPCSLANRRATFSHLPDGFDRESEELEWVVLDASSVTDSGTCSASSFDSSLDIQICKDDLPSQTQTHDKPEPKNEQKPASNRKQRNYIKWRVKRTEFMVPLFQHKQKTFEKKIKLCMGPGSPCLPVTFKLFPNGVGSDENIYSSFRVELPSVTQIIPQGTSLAFHITVCDLHTADVLVSRHMEVAMENESYMLEQFLAHEVIKSSQARHFEISIMMKVNAKSSGWVEIQSQR